jgi:hypothetical protein
LIAVSDRAASVIGGTGAGHARDDEAAAQRRNTGADSRHDPYRLALAERLGGVPIDLRTQSLAAGGHAAGFDAVDLAIDTSGKTVARWSALVTAKD